MTKPNDGGNVYPHQKDTVRDGISVRTWLAGMAMQGLCANPDFTNEDYSVIAESAVMQADAVFAELNKE